MKEIIQKVKNLSVGFKSQKGNEISILKNITTNIKKGERFNYANIIIKRPGTGIPSYKWHKVIGKKAKKNFTLDEQIVL